MYYLGKNNIGVTLTLKAKEVSKIESITGAERLDHSKIIAWTAGGIILTYAFCKAFILTEDVSLRVINPNYINFKFKWFTNAKRY